MWWIAESSELLGVMDCWVVECWMMWIAGRGRLLNVADCGTWWIFGHGGLLNVRIDECGRL